MQRGKFGRDSATPVEVRLFEEFLPIMFRFLHTADWQVGKQFANIKGDAAAYLRNRRFETIEQIAAIATQQKVDAVLVAGDVFETNIVNAKTIMQTFGAMGQFDGKWFLLPGNHDSAEPNSVWSRVKKTMSSENIVVLDHPEPYYLREHQVVILPAPLQRRHEARDLTKWFDDFNAEDGWIRIGLAHGSIDNRLERGEAPNTISDTRAESAKLDYFALGDWHGTMNIAERTWYSGTPEPDRFKANDAGNVLLVEISEHGAKPSVEKISTGHYIWSEVEQQIFAEEDLNALELSLLTPAVSPRRRLVRLSLSGTVSLETRLAIDQALERLSAALFYIETDDTNLIAQPTGDDLDEIAQSGFVRTAINKLLAIASDANSEDQDAAQRALQILYVQHKQLESGKC